MAVEGLDAIADRGYDASEEICACEEAGITVILPEQMTSNSQAAGLFGKQDFRYVAEEVVYTCPAGQSLAYFFRTEDKGLQSNSEPHLQSYHLSFEGAGPEAAMLELLPSGEKLVCVRCFVSAAQGRLRSELEDVKPPQRSLRHSLAQHSKPTTAAGLLLGGHLDRDPVLLPYWRAAHRVISRGKKVARHRARAANLVARKEHKPLEPAGKRPTRFFVQRGIWRNTP